MTRRGKAGTPKIEAWGLTVDEDGSSWRDDVSPDVELEQVWTIVDPGTGTLYALPGFHRVNMVGYCITERPWSSPTDEAVYA